MAVDTSRDAVERLALRMEGIARQTTVYASLDRAHAGDAAATLRALLAEVEALRKERDSWQAAAIATEAMMKARGTNRDYWESRAEHVEAERDAALAERDRLTEAFSAIEAECWDVRCIDVPTGCGDADVQWVVIAHYMAAPKEREVGHGTSPLSAIQAALASIKKEPTDGE